MGIETLSNEELMKMRDVPDSDISSLSTEALMKMRSADTPNPTGSFWENTKAGGGKVFYDLARGAGQLARDALTPSAQVFFDQEQKPKGVSDLVAPKGPIKVKNVADMIGLPTQGDIDDAKALDKPLMDTVGGKVGNMVTGAALAAPTALIPGANTATGAGIVGGVMGALQPVATGESRAVNTALGTAVGGATQLAAGKVASTLQNRAASKATDAATLQAQNATRDAALEAGKKAGYVVPPTTVKPGLVNEALESAAGKVSTGQAASAKNQKITDSLGREALGLKKDALLTEGSLADLRAQAGKSYQAIKDLPGKFKADAEFQKAAQTLGGDFAAAAEVVPSTVKNEAIEALKNDLSKGEWSAKGIIEAVKKLRFDATQNYKALGDPGKAALADAQRSAADALDGLVERNLASTGQQAMADAYKAARVLIAKAHDVEAALMGDGHLNAQIIARIGQKKDLTDQLATISDFASSFPKATQPAAKVGSAGVNAIRSSVGAGVGTIVGGPVGGAIGAGAGVAIPWTVRNALLSGAGQSALAKPSYGTGGSRTIADLMANPALRASLPAATVGGMFQNRAQQ